MDKRIIVIALIIFGIIYQSCSDDDMVTIPIFNFPETEIFEQNISSYNIFQGEISDLIPSDDYHLVDLSSVLFTDYSKKQRLVKVPLGTELSKLNDDTINFPDGTILVKTFYYYHDERDTSLGKNIIETRLMIKNSALWNVATYIWNEGQTDAFLEIAGEEKEISWIDANGNSLSTLYDIPDKNECIACHQSSATTIPLGTTLRNINREVIRDSLAVNQIEYLQSLAILSNDFNHSEISEMVDFNDNSISLDLRARAYLHMNCAHCHNPTAWEEAADQNLDFRYSTSFSETGLSAQRNQQRIPTIMSRGEMPFIGTTLLDDEGINLISEYIESL